MPKILEKVLLLLAFVGFVAHGQESATETGDEETTALQGAPADAQSETNAIEPAVSTTPAAQEVQSGAPPGRVIDEIELSRTEVTGNQELPKVLYIVPWQKSDPGDLTGKPVNTLLDEVLAPIDRSQFIRQVEYYGELYGTDEE